jgi:hypothetical protein
MQLRFITRAASESLNASLGLPARGTEQDWDIELADASRVEEFLDCLERLTNEDERFALLSLIVASADSRLDSDGQGPWLGRVRNAVQGQPGALASLAGIWIGNDPPNSFAITPHLSDLMPPEVPSATTRND